MNVVIYYCKWDEKQAVDKQIESHELLRQAAGKYIADFTNENTGKTQPSLTVIRDGIYGKPYFKEWPDLHFSISHSGTIWSCAFSSREVGLDLQELRERDCEKIARRFFHPEEISWLEQQGFDQFCRLWAYKESYVKYFGDGLQKGLDYFSVVSSDLFSENTGHAISGAQDVVQQEIPFQDGYWMVVTGGTSCTVVLKELQVDEINKRN